MTTPERVLLNAILRAEFKAFLQRCFLTLNPGAPFLPNWHIEALAYHLELVRLGKIRRLIVNMPPRSLKSINCSVAFPAFVLGHDPRKRLIVASYGADLATKLGNDCRAILQAPWYRSVFPGTRISRIKNTESEVMTTREHCDYPTLKARAIAHARLHRPTEILIEDTGVGTALVPELRNSGFTVISVQVEHNKQTRMSVQSAKFAGGHVLFPTRAPWLENLEAELFAFPASRFDDQVDSISQALGHQIQVSSWNAKSAAGFSKFVEGLAMEQYWRSMGRPW
jgi:predicted phage terminase large subunit-like protein